jgi:hypothetical protein
MFNFVKMDWFTKEFKFLELLIKDHNHNMLKGFVMCEKCGHVVNKDYTHDEATVYKYKEHVLKEGCMGHPMYTLTDMEKILHVYTCYTCKPQKTSNTKK